VLVPGTGGCKSHYAWFSGGSDGHHGVGLLVRKSLADKCVVTVTPISNRLMTAKLQKSDDVSLRAVGSPLTINIVVAYAPTEADNISVKRSFFTELETLIASFNGNEQVYVLIDANARVGPRQPCDDRRVVGNFGRDDRKPTKSAINGEEL
jgi:exonuclease III